jgi:hypothetical protein
MRRSQVPVVAHQRDLAVCDVTAGIGHQDVAVEEGVVRMDVAVHRQRPDALSGRLVQQI